MKFSKIEKIDNVKQYTVNQHGFFYLTNDVVIPRFPELNLKSMGFDDWTEIMLLGDFLCVQDVDGRAILYDIPAEAVVYTHTDLTNDGYGFIRNRIGNNRKIMCKSSTLANKQTFIFDVDKNEYEEINVTWNQNINFGELLLKREVKPQSISRVELDGTEVWKHNISGTFRDIYDSSDLPDKLAHVIGLHDDLLWLVNISDKLYAIDIATGDIKYSSKDVGYANYYMINSSRNKLMALDTESLRTIDVSNDKFEYKATSITEIFEEHGCRPDFNGRPFPIIDSHIVFCDQFKSVIGTFNYDTMQIDWTHDVFESRDYAMINELTYHDGKLYALDNIDSSPSLHVFEKV